jgi:hypothetical protein
MLDADTVLRQAIGPARDVPRREDPGNAGLEDVAGLSFLVFFSRTKTLPPLVSTFHELTGSSAGARSASPLRRLKQA